MELLTEKLPWLCRLGSARFAARGLRPLLWLRDNDFARCLRPRLWLLREAEAEAPSPAIFQFNVQRNDGKREKLSRRLGAKNE